MTAPSVPVPPLAHELAAALPALDAGTRSTALALYRLLSHAEPVAVERLAERVDRPRADVERLLETWPGVYRDHRGRVIGFWGLALGGTPHRLSVDGRELAAWCAWDTLFIPGILGRPARVESTCPATGETIRLRVEDSGPVDVSPAGAILSFVRREEPFDADTITSFCHFVHFFASEDAADAWTAEHPGTFAMSIEDGYEVGRIANELVWRLADA